MKSPKMYVLFSLIGVLGAALAIVPAQAQSARASVNIPFDFVVGKATLKAGNYSLAKQGASILSITDEDGKTRYTMLTPGGNVHRSVQPYLVFTRYQGTSFLNKVVFSTEFNYELSRSTREKELISRLKSGDQVAVLIGEGQ